MAAQLRDYCLSTLGIVQYVPKDFVSPNALYTDRVAVQTAVPPVVDTDSKDKLPEVDAGKARAIADQLATVSTVEACNTADQQEETNPPKEMATTDGDTRPVRFRMASWQPVADMLVFSTLDYGQNPQQDQQQLLANILSAIKRLPSGLTEPDLRDWPVIPNAPAGEAEAKIMFSEYLGSEVSKGAVKWVLVFGERAKAYLLANYMTVAADEQSVTLADGVVALVLPALDEMLNEPAQKRVAWDLLRPLANNLPK